MPTTHDVGYNAAGVAYTYTTPQALYDSAAFVSGDTMRLNYSTQYKCPHWFARLLINNAAKLTVTIVGATTLGVPISWAYDSSQIVPSINDTVLTVEDIIFAQEQLYLAPATSVTATLNRCGFRTGSFSVSTGNGAAAHTVTLNNCWAWGSGTLAFVNSASSGATMICNNCTVTRHRYGFYRGNASTSGSLTAINCIAEHSAANLPFNNLTIAGSTNNAARIVNACGANAVDLASTPPVWLEEITFAMPHWSASVRNTSGLLTAGANSGLSADVLGKAYSGGNYPIGCSAGTEFVDLSKLLENATPAGSIPLANVLTASGGTFDEAARNTDPGVGKVRTGTSYKIQNVSKAGTDVLPATTDVKEGVQYGTGGTEYTGAYTVGALPTIPTVTAVDDNTGSSTTITISAGDAGSTNKVYYSRVGGTYEWTLADTITGNGDVQITGLYVGSWYVYVTAANGAGTVATPIVQATIANSTNDYVTPRRVVRIVETAARNFVRKAKRRGIQIYWINNCSETGTQVWAMRESFRLGVAVEGAETDVERAVFHIPRQYTDAGTLLFPVEVDSLENIGINSRIYDNNGKLWRVDAVTGDVEGADISAVFRCECSRRAYDPFIGTWTPGS